MGLDWFNLLLTSGALGTLGACCALCRPLCIEDCLLPGACFWPVGLEPPGMKDSFVSCYLVYPYPHSSWMSPHLGLGHSGGEECKICCLGGLCHINNTLHVCITPQKHCGVVH